MGLKDLTDPQAVIRAINEFDAIGQDGFLAKYGFAAARSYFLVYNSKEYPSKAIVGVAHKYQFPKKGILTSDSFSGGKATVKPKLEKLKFTVRVSGRR